MAWYVVDLRCECGETHWVSNGFQLTPGPTEAGTVAELYPSGNLPAALASLLRDLVWCDQTGEYVELADPARVVLTPYVAEASR
jgi:hypothetical protein